MDHFAKICGERFSTYNNDCLTVSYVCDLKKWLRTFPLHEIDTYCTGLHISLLYLHLLVIGQMAEQAASSSVELTFACDWSNG
jgi:hypothetical protein